jgi:hypothetical protein
VSAPIVLQLTPEEAHGLVTLMDAACKAGGLTAAILAAPIFAKLQAAADQPAQPNASAEA